MTYRLWEFGAEIREGGETWDHPGRQESGSNLGIWYRPLVTDSQSHEVTDSVYIRRFIRIWGSQAGIFGIALAGDRIQMSFDFH